MSLPAPAPVSWEDFLALPEDDPRELLDGLLVEMDTPTRAHERAVAALIVVLGTWAETHKAEILASAYRVRGRRDRGFMPDVQLYFADNPAERAELGLEEGRPDLVVEVISPCGFATSSRLPTGETRAFGTARYDRVTKVQAYAEMGIPEYWLVDPAARTLERLVLRGDIYAIEQNAQDEVFEPRSLPGLSFSLACLWVP